MKPGLNDGALKRVASVRPSWKFRAGRKLEVVDLEVVDQDIFYGEEGPVCVVVVYSDAAPWDTKFMVISERGEGHALETALSEWQNYQTAKPVDQGILNDVIEELGEDASEEDQWDAYRDAVTENWEYVSWEWGSVDEMLQELETQPSMDEEYAAAILGSFNKEDE